MIEAGTEQNALGLLIRATREGGALQPFHIQSGDEPALRLCLEAGLLGEEDDEDMEPVAYLLTPTGEEVVERSSAEDEEDLESPIADLLMHYEQTPAFADGADLGDDEDDEEEGFFVAYLPGRAGTAAVARRAA